MLIIGVFYRLNRCFYPFLLTFFIGRIMHLHFLQCKLCICMHLHIIWLLKCVNTKKTESFCDPVLCFIRFWFRFQVGGWSARECRWWRCISLARHGWWKCGWSSQTGRTHNVKPIMRNCTLATSSFYFVLNFWISLQSLIIDIFRPRLFLIGILA